MDRVVAEEMSVRLDRTQVVDRDHLDVASAVLGDRSKYETTDAAKAVDCDADGHVFGNLQ